MRACDLPPSKMCLEPGQAGRLLEQHTAGAANIPLLLDTDVKEQAETSQLFLAAGGKNVA